MSEPQWQFGRDYDLLAASPEGVAGSIWLVRVQQDGSERAIKILRPELTGEPEAVEEFRALLDAVGALAHPGILVPDETVVHGDRVALVMTRTAGEDLGALLERTRLPTPAPVLLIFAEVCDALAAAHAAGIVHGDVKPSNVLLEQDPETGAPGAVLLCDFGIAALAARHGVQVLPAEYQAPENSGGARRPTSAADVYAVGAVLYEALAGRPPFVGAEPEEAARPHREARPPRIPALPEPLWLLTAACLNEHPDQRPTAAHVAQLLREIAPTVTVVSPPASASQETIRIARIPAAATPKPVIATAAAAATAAGTEPAAAAAAAPVEATRVVRAARAEQGGAADDAERRPVFSGGRGVALAMLGVAAVSVALAVVHMASGSAPQTLTVGSATAPALTLGSSSGQFSSIVATTQSPAATLSGSATPTSTPSPSADNTSGSATPSPSASTGSAAPSADGSPVSSASAVVSATPSTAASSTPPNKGPATISWECSSGQQQRSSVDKQACIGLGSDGALYIQGTFTSAYGQTIPDINISLYGNGQVFDTMSESCDSSSCTMTGGPYEPSAGGYQAYAWINGSSRYALSPSVDYQGG